MATRKRYTKGFKAKIVLEMLKAERTLNEISSAYGIHANQLRQWKNAALDYF